MYLFSRFFAIPHKNRYFLSMTCKTLKLTKKKQKITKLKI